MITNRCLKCNNQWVSSDHSSHPYSNRQKSKREPPLQPPRDSHDGGRPLNARSNALEDCCEDICPLNQNCCLNDLNGINDKTINDLMDEIVTQFVSQWNVNKLFKSLKLMTQILRQLFVRQKPIRLTSRGLSNTHILCQRFYGLKFFF